MNRGRHLRTGLALGAALGVVQCASAAFGGDYDNAVVQVERGNYAAALPLLDAVIGDVPASQKRVRLYGMRFAPYTPYFYRGLAHYRLGRCDDALRDFAHEARFDVLDAGKGTAMAQAEADCRTQLAAAGASAPVHAATEAAPAHIGALQALVAAYFRGDYALVAGYDPAVLQAPAEQAQAWLYRAAAQYTLAVLSGDDGSALADVRASLAKARESGSPAVDLAQFPPKFVRLIEPQARP